MRGMTSFAKRPSYIMAAIAISALLALLAAPAYCAETKTAYTRDGIHFVSLERVEENIRYEYAKPGDYREVQVPLDAVVVGESLIPENISHEQKAEAIEKSNSSSTTQPAAHDPSPSPQERYPYAPISIALLVLAGLAFAAATIFSGMKRR
ncbi:MAG TPA: hypothetical protein PKK68_09045 [Methanothrix soehngenii]|nr:hypothetical protein [Methanothrix soehngenii]